MLCFEDCLNRRKSFISCGFGQLFGEEPFANVVLCFFFIPPLPAPVRFDDDIESVILSVESNRRSAERFFHVNEELAEPASAGVTLPEQPYRVRPAGKH